MKIAFLTDIHEDIIFLKKAFRKADKAGVSKFICLGDMIGYTQNYSDYSESRDGRKCLDLIMDRCTEVVLGNHDMHAAQIIPKQSAVFDYPPNWYELNVYKKKELCNDELWLPELDELDPLISEDHKHYLRLLPEYSTLNFDHLKLLLSHYIYPNLSGAHKHFLRTSEQLEDHFNFMKQHSCNLSFVGHGHYSKLWLAKFDEQGQIEITYGKSFQFTPEYTARSRYIIGVPPVTRNGRSGFCIFDTESLSIENIVL
jgi:predicted phosphodiesterase